MSTKQDVIDAIAAITTKMDLVDAQVNAAIAAGAAITGGHGVDLNWAKVKREVAGMGNGPDTLRYAVAALDSAESALAALVTTLDTALDALASLAADVDTAIATADATADALP